MSEARLPAVRTEKEEYIAFCDLQAGYLVKVFFKNANLPYSELIGICKSKTNSEIVLEIPSDKLVANTAGRMCESRAETYCLDCINYIQILAREFHAVSQLFDALGVSEVYRKNAEDRIKKAQDCLQDKSGLNFVNWIF